MNPHENSCAIGPARVRRAVSPELCAIVAAFLFSAGALPAAATAGEPETAGRAVLGPERQQGDVIQVSAGDGGAKSAPVASEAAAAGASPETETIPAQESRPLGAAPAPAALGGIRTGDDGGRAMTDLVGGRELARVALALLGVIGLILLLRLWVRRIGGPFAGAPRPSGVVEILARYPVARSQQLILMKLGRRLVLLHQSRTGMTTLSELRDPQEVAALLASVEAAGSAKFPRLLGRFLADQRNERSGAQGTPLAGNEVVDLTRRPRVARRASSETPAPFAARRRGGAR